MTVIFRVDASVHIGNGHVMRCITLADVLSSQGINCQFICRIQQGDMREYIQQRGYVVHSLAVASGCEDTYLTDKAEPYKEWLGVKIETDYKQTIEIIKNLQGVKVNWLVIDHYSLSKEWEGALRPYCQYIMVIDDLANRIHDCDILLDQTYGRLLCDYAGLTPTHSQQLLGAKYSLIRPEFSEYRDYSISRRQENAKIKQILITLGGVDKNNVTGKVLSVLVNSDLVDGCRIKVVLGKNSPGFGQVKKQVMSMGIPVEVLVAVENMAQLMAESDVCIGAAGSTAWERCCLGLPTIMLVLAENQRTIANELAVDGVALLASDVSEINKLLKEAGKKLAVMTEKSLEVTDGTGASLVSRFLSEFDEDISFMQ